MKEILDQWTKNMGKMWEPWQKMMTNTEWGKMDSPYRVNWSLWLSAVRSSCDVNASWWRMFLDQTEEVFFRTLRESPFYTQSIEEQMREFGANVRKAQSLQLDSMKEYLDKMEAVLKEPEQGK